MADEAQVVKEGEPNLEESTPQEEQELTGSEPVETPVSDIQKNLKIALQKERERRKAAEAQLRQPQYQAPESEDETVRRFLNVEATTLINNKLLTDPSFRDRVDLVKDEMLRTGKNIDDADNAVLAKLFRDMTEGQTEETIKAQPPKQLKTQASPETEEKVSPETQAEIDQFDRAKKAFG